MENLPRIVENETNPELLKGYFQISWNASLLLHKENKRLRSENGALMKKKAEEDQQKLKLDKDLTNFKETYDKLNKKKFGKSSEKRPSSRQRDVDRQLSLQSESLAPPPKSEEMDRLEEVRVDHRLTKEELAKIAEEYGYPKDAKWESLKIFDESNEVGIRVKSFIRKRHYLSKYRLIASKGTEKEIIVTASGPKRIVPGSKYSPDFAVDVVAQKYLYHLPLERIRRMIASNGLSIGVKTLYSLSFFVKSHLEDVAQRIQQEIGECGLILHMDETPWPINNSTEKNGYMWTVSNQGGSYYKFASTRSGAIAKELLGSYRGPVLTDAYPGYNAHFKYIKGVTLAHCWAHARRKFTDIEKNYPEECNQVLDLLSELFVVETKAQHYTHLLELRQSKSKKIINQLRDLLYELAPKTRGESELQKAINYVLKHWSNLVLFLNDPKIPLTNNEAERAMRHCVMGRKNFYGSKTAKGAETAATLYTVIESCKKVELDPRNYISMAVKKVLNGETPLTPLQYAKHIRS